jgi:hypothetical protein
MLLTGAWLSRGLQRRQEQPSQQLGARGGGLPLPLTGALALITAGQRLTRGSLNQTPTRHTYSRPKNFFPVQAMLGASAP